MTAFSLFRQHATHDYLCVHANPLIQILYPPPVPESLPPSAASSPPSPSGPSSPRLYKAALTGNANNVTTSATGSISVTLVNSSYATAIFYAINIKQMTMAHLHMGTPATVPAGQNGPILVWAFNSTYGPISGSLRSSFMFNPSLNNVSSLLAAGQVYFNIHTTASPSGELRGQLAPPM